MTEKVTIFGHHLSNQRQEPDNNRDQQRRHRLQQRQPKKERTKLDEDDLDLEVLKKVEKIAGSSKNRKNKERRRNKDSQVASTTPSTTNSSNGQVSVFSTPTTVRSRRTRRPRTTSSYSTTRAGDFPSSTTSKFSSSSVSAEWTSTSAAAGSTLVSSTRPPLEVSWGISSSTASFENLSFATPVVPTSPTTDMPSILRHHQQLGTRVINITVYPEVSKEAVVVPILTSMFAFPVLAFTLICLLRRRAQRLRKFEPRHRALRVNTSFSPSRGRGKTSISTPGTPAPYGFAKNISCLPAIIVDPPFIAAPHLDPSKHKMNRLTPPSTPPTSSSGAENNQHSTIKQIVAAATASAVRFEVQVNVEHSSKLATGTTTSNTLSEVQINGEDSGVCCSIPRESFSSTSGLNGDETVDCDKDGDKNDGNGEEVDEQVKSTPPTLLSAFSGADKMTAAMMNVQMVDKITVSLGSDDDGSSSDSAKEPSEEDDREDDEESDQAVTVLLEPPAEFADVLQRRQSLFGSASTADCCQEDDSMRRIIDTFPLETPPTSVPTSATSMMVSSEAMFASPEDFHISGAEARPNSPTFFSPTNTPPADVIATLSRTMSTSASGCRVIEVCIPASNSASEKEEDRDVEFDRRSSSVSSIDGKRDDEGYYQETDDDVEEGSERTLTMLPRPSTARVISKGVQVNDLKIGNAFIRSRTKIPNGSVVRPVDRSCGVEKGAIISEVRANIALRSVQQQQQLVSASSSPWVLRSSATGLSSSSRRVSRQIR